MKKVCFGWPGGYCMLYSYMYMFMYMYMYMYAMYNFFLLRYSNISITFTCTCIYNAEEIIAMFNNSSMAVLMFVVQRSIIRYM